MPRERERGLQEGACPASVLSAEAQIGRAAALHKGSLAALSPDGGATCWTPGNPAQPVPVREPKGQMWGPKISPHPQAIP